MLCVERAKADDWSSAEAESGEREMTRRKRFQWQASKQSRVLQGVGG